MAPRSWLCGREECLEAPTASLEAQKDRLGSAMEFATSLEFSIVLLIWMLQILGCQEGVWSAPIGKEIFLAHEISGGGAHKNIIPSWGMIENDAK